jgi:hypothetical protein
LTKQKTAEILKILAVLFLPQTHAPTNARAPFVIVKNPWIASLIQNSVGKIRFHPFVRLAQPPVGKVR